MITLRRLLPRQVIFVSPNVVRHLECPSVQCLEVILRRPAVKSFIPMKISSWPLKASNINIYGHWAMIQETGPPYITPIDSLLLLGSCWINSHHLFRSRRYDADPGSNPLYLTVWLTKPLGHPQRGFDTFRKKLENQGTCIGIYVCITYSIIIFPIFRESEENGIWESQSYCIYVYRKGLSNYRAVGVLRIGSL